MRRLVISGLLLAWSVAAGCGGSALPVRAPAPTPPPAKTAAPTTAMGDGRPAVATWGTTAVRFADQAEAHALLSKADGFTKAMGDFDRQARLSTTDPVDEATFLKHAGAQARGWPAATWERWQKAIRAVGKTLSGLNVPMPETVLFIATTGREEFDTPYTRGAAIVIPEKVALELSEPFGLIAHELFHVITRHTPKLRDGLYAIAGFRPVGTVAHPAGYSQQRLTNPDAYENTHAIMLSADDRSFLGVPLIRAKSAVGDGTSAQLLSSLEIYLLEVDTSGAAVLGAQGEPLIHSMLATDYNAKAALNTAYAIHPEEVLADNFALMLKRRAGLGENVARPDVLDQVQAAFTP